MKEGVGSTFPTSVELEWKRNDEMQGLCVDLEPISPCPCLSHALRLFQVKFQVTSGFPRMALSRLSMRYIGGLSMEDLKPRAINSLLSRNTSSSKTGDVTLSFLYSHSA